MPAETRYALITGSASGLGRALAVRLARDGWHLGLVDVDEANNQETLELVRRAGGDGHLESMDVSDRHAWMPLVARLQAAWPRLDLLANNAGVAASGEIGRFDLDDWHWVLGINLLGVVYGCHALVDWLKANPDGSHIMMTSSLAGMISPPTMAAYNLSKAALISFSETLYCELAKDKVGVTVLCPSFFDSNLLATARMFRPEERTLADQTMKKARFTADDVARAAIRAMRRKHLYVILPFKGRIWWWLKRAFPAIFYWCIAQIYKKGLPESL